MADVIKGVVEPVSGTLMKLLRKNPSMLREHVQALREELEDLGAARPVIIAFGTAARALLAENLRADEYSRLVGVTHYADHIGKEQYRDRVHQQLRYDAMR